MDERIYDANHKYAGRRTKDCFGNDVIKDKNGKTVARCGEDMLGNKVVRDASGKVTGIFGQDLLGNSVVRDPDGKVKQRYGHDILGNEAVTDANGRVIGYIENDRSAPAAPAVPAYTRDDDDERPAYTVGNGVRIYPRSTEEKAFYAATGRFILPAWAAFLLPALYCAAAIFVKKLPASPALLIGLLTAGIFLSSIFGRSGSWTRSEQTGTFVTSVLLFFAWFIVWTTYRTHWNAAERKELTVILGGPALFLIAELIGGAIGKAKHKSIRKRIFGGK